MQKTTILTRVTNVLIYSPYSLLVFLLIPAFTIINLKMHYRVSGDLLLDNNIGFCI